ncbi:serine-threonine protein kinase, putative [Entamoeba invadens IP1]|uniref:Serine-threonine protein kinase, putative n=1 Tax=Entamoeba invadens IP1 TaxID=370355 RepID=A0A0A1UGJ1_ENTIV|nr:serine-threonine protein kinase, putative [Entamoeba invadens IP1]ELP92702.1 serine-threonine protein kinase, putative [Entamoeba invadens IP1]|eukprot:XP_004259473.1 serine-threonine protein kinase, putative [Entamoeba invadens IP1]
MFIVLLISLAVSSTISDIIGPGCVKYLNETVCLSCGSNYDTNDLTCNTCETLNPFLPISSDNKFYSKNATDFCVDNSQVHVSENYSIIPGFVANTTFIYGTPVVFTAAFEQLYHRPCKQKMVYRSPYTYGIYFDVPIHSPTDDKEYSFQTKLNWTVGEYHCTVIELSDSDPTVATDECVATAETIDSIMNCNWIGKKTKHYRLFLATEKKFEATKFGVGVLIITEPVFDPLIFFYARNIELLNQTKGDLYLGVPMKNGGNYEHPVCLPQKVMKTVSFKSQLIEGVSLLAKSIGSKLRYVQSYDEVTEEVNGEVVKRRRCLQLFGGMNEGALEKQGIDQGISFLIQYNKSKEADGKYNGMNYQEITFSYLTDDEEEDDVVKVTVVCPNDCNSDIGAGVCSHRLGGCLCKDNKYGRACMDICYNTTTREFNAKYGDQKLLCRYGESHCDIDCECDDGYQVVNNSCVKLTCLNNIDTDKSLECLKGSAHCETNCECAEGYKYRTFGVPNKGCILKTCGNGLVEGDEICDGGVNCLDNCSCSSYEMKSNGLNGCKSTNEVPTWAIIVIVLGVIFIFVVIIVVAIILVMKLIKAKHIDLSIFRQQQPFYYFDITQSTSLKTIDSTSALVDPNPVNNKMKIVVSHSKLNFGTEDSLVDINETRFEKFMISNNSSCYMLVVFHAPDIPKYVFHFDPQVYVIHPHRLKIFVIYMTVFCTTKMLGLKIHFSVYLSKKREVLKSISDLLFDKTFNEWDEQCKMEMDTLMRDVRNKYHGSLIIDTDAINSINLDLDEIDLIERPIGEGAMGKVYLGRYRGTYVAVKQFHWESLTNEETEELKQDVVRECNLLSKLRNPFIVNYVGSITYIPQVSMVTVFFELGSLENYIRKGNDYNVVLSFSLKNKILYDIARGMNFLHNNSILHLDLKPDNLLVNSLYADSACCVKITDFGTSRFVQKLNRDKGLGTPTYIAPESFEDIYDCPNDVYSFAMTAWELFYATEPYADFKSLFEIQNFVKDGKRLPLDNTIPVEWKNLIVKCWAQVPHDRPNFSSIVTEVSTFEHLKYPELDAGINSDIIDDLIQKKKEHLQEMFD